MKTPLFTALVLTLGFTAAAQPTDPAAAESAIAGRATPAVPAALYTSMDSLDEQHRLAAGDTLSYRVLEDKDEPRSLVVSDAGELDVPYYGRVKAVNKTCRELAEDIRKVLEKTLYYKATVIVAVEQLNKKRGSVYLIGQVKRPGPVEIPSDEVLTLTKAIMSAGGFADFANQKRVRLTREGEGDATKPKTLEVDVQSIFEKSKTENDLPLEPGDLIYVPTRAINF